MPLCVGDFPPRFVDAASDLGDPAIVEGYYRALESRPVRGAAALEEWLLDWAELDAWTDEEESIRYVESTCQTDDPEREKRYLSFIEDVSPVIKSWSDRLNRKLLACSDIASLPKSRYEVFLRRVKNAVDLFREENIQLQTEDEKLRQQYQKVVGCMTVQHDGREQTLQEMNAYLERTDRAVRKDVWEKIAAPWAQARAQIDEIYDQMIALRHRIAVNAGRKDYREFAFAEMERFDYTPADCERFADSIEQIVVPVARKLGDARRKQLGLETLRPWDMAVDPLGRAPLEPFSGAKALMDGCGRIFGKVSEVFGHEFGRMRAEGLLDLESRKGKAPGGYMMAYDGRRLPFIFMNAVGRQDDVQTLLHEGGHAFHAFAARDEDLAFVREAPIEFAEVASMGMELLAGRFIDEFYADAVEAERARIDHLDGVVRFFPYMACIDMLQHWVYTHPEHTREDRAAAWTALNRRFNDWVDHKEYEDSLAYLWHRKGHPFTVPFYYVEYGIAQLGALGVWLNSQRDFAGAVSSYRRALGLGGKRPLPELFSTAGIRFDFSASAIQPLISAASKTLSA
jgi:oligoendopeptidase F